MEELMFAEGHVSTDAMSLALDGMLDVREQVAFEQHVHTCHMCQVQWTRWQAISRVLAVEPLVGPVPGLAMRVDRRIQEHQQRRERLVGSLVVLGGTISVWTVLLMGVVLTSAVWLVVSPEARLQALQFLLFAGDLAGLVLANLGTVRDSVLGLLPSPAILLTAGMVLLLLGGLWAWLVTAGGQGRFGLPAPGEGPGDGRGTNGATGR